MIFEDTQWISKSLSEAFNICISLKFLQIKNFRILRISGQLRFHGRHTQVLSELNQYFFIIYIPLILKQQKSTKVAKISIKLMEPHIILITLLNSSDTKEDVCFHVSSVEVHSLLPFTNLKNISSKERKKNTI